MDKQDLIFHFSIMALLFVLYILRCRGLSTRWRCCFQRVKKCLCDEGGHCLLAKASFLCGRRSRHFPPQQYGLMMCVCPTPYVITRQWRALEQGTELWRELLTRRVQGVAASKWSVWGFFWQHEGFFKIKFKHHQYLFKQPAGFMSILGHCVSVV